MARWPLAGFTNGRVSDKYDLDTRCLYFDADIFSSSLDGRTPLKGVAVQEIKEVLDRILSRAGILARDKVNLASLLEQAEV